MGIGAGALEFEVPKGSEPVGRRVALPAGAASPIKVYVNGIEQSEGEDYRLTERGIVFARPIVKEKVGGMRWLAMFLGLFGTYRMNETVDVEFTRHGKVELAHDVRVVLD